MLHFEAVVRRVPASGWDNRTCCTEWTARELVGHTLKVMTFTEAACGIEGTVPEDTFDEIAGEEQQKGDETSNAWKDVDMIDTRNGNDEM